MPSKKWIIILILPMIIILAWKMAYPTDSFRYKVTVNVETPEGIKSGYAVREFIVKQQPPVAGSGPGNFVRGEAVAVDLGKRGVLFATIDSDDEFLVFHTFPIELAMTHKGMSYYERLEAKAEVDPLYYPLLVAFKDIADPKTVTVAYKPVREPDDDKPGLQYKVVGIEDNMEELFGPGVRLKDITLEMTKEKVTWGIEKWLLWLREKKYKGGTLSGDTFFNKVPAQERILTGDNFKQGDK